MRVCLTQLRQDLGFFVIGETETGVCGAGLSELTLQLKLGRQSAMRATIKNYIDAANRRREEEGEEGFSLIELIIVVVILGILVAIAVPIFVNIQESAQKNAVAAAAANGATAVATTLANNSTTPNPSVADAAASAGTSGKIKVTGVAGKNTTVSDVCVNATDGKYAAVAGPGCGTTAAVVSTP